MKTTVLALLYFAPWIVAFVRNHSQTNAIFAVNLLLGWTLVGWVWALAWSLMADTPSEQAGGAPCRACREPIDREATICPHCRTELPHGAPGEVRN